MIKVPTVCQPCKNYCLNTGGIMGEQDGLTSGKGGSGGKEAGVVTGEETEGSGLDG